MSSEDDRSTTSNQPAISETADPEGPSWPSKSEDVSDEPLVDNLINSPSYAPAVMDTGFLKLNEARGMRLGLDYLKPETLLEQRGVKHTIVVFGSTRIVEPNAANRRLKRAQEAAHENPDDVETIGRLKIAERIAAKATYYEIAREFGELVGQSGRGPKDCRLLLMTGGGPGIMEAANRGARDAGAESAGLNITLPHEQYPNPYITPELCFSVHYFSTRKLHFLMRAKALVVFPGGFGTLDELFETLTLVQTRKIQPLPVVLVGESYWREVINIDFLVSEGVIDIEDKDLFWYAETADEIWQGIVKWHRMAGTDFLGA